MGPGVPGRGLRAGRTPELPRRPHGRLLRARARDQRGVSADPWRIRAAADALEPGISPDAVEGILASLAAPAAGTRPLHARDAVPHGGRVAHDPPRDRN